MKELLVLMSIAFLMVPCLAFAEGNLSPYIYLEMHNFAADPDPVPDYICICPVIYPGAIDCWADKSAMGYGFVPIHIAKTENGFLGVPFGMTATGGDVIFLSSVACEGFLKGPSTAGEPEAIIISSTGTCYGVDPGYEEGFRYHVGYLKYLTTNVTATYFDIVASGDLLHNRVINCDNLYDDGTVIGGNAQWGGIQDITCGSGGTDVELSTWGKIKGLYR